MDLKEARYILAIAHYKSIRKSSKSPAYLPAFSQQIPQESGTAAWLPPLFPSGAGYIPTYMGERYLYYAEQIAAFARKGSGI